jgi:hypothetical protein
MAWQRKVRVCLPGFEPVTFGSGVRLSEFHDLLNISKLWQHKNLHLAGFSRFWKEILTRIHT